MSRSRLWRAAAVLAVVATAVAIVILRPVRLGLDLRGGTQIVLETRPRAGAEIGRDTIDRTLEVLRRRVDQLGVSEPTLQRSGDRRIIVELPGVSDPKQALEVIGRTAQLTMHPVAGVELALPEGSPLPEQTPTPEDGVQIVADEEGNRLRLGPPALTGDDIGDAQATYNDAPPGWTVDVEMRGEGGRAFEELTGQAACAQPGDPARRIAIVLDERVISSPEVSQEIACGSGISGGRTLITGSFTQDEAKDLALLVRAGALPVPVEVIEQRTVGPTLGAEAIRASVQAAIIGGLLTIAYMVAYYRVLGVLAAIALVVYGLVSYAAVVALGATLTLPGIAGFVLAIGMAVDANVLVFERVKDEHAAGKSVRAAVAQGFPRAWSAIADSNATTLLAAVLLFWLSAGAVRGFGVTLTIGVIASMFTAMVVTRLLTEAVVRRRHANASLLGVASGRRLRAWLASSRIDLISHRRTWFAVSAVAIVLAVAGLGTRGLNFGLEFTGGELREYSTERPPDLDELRSELAAAGLPRAVVQSSGDGNVTVRTSRLSAADGAKVRDSVSKVGGQARVARSEFVGPTIGNELRRKAVIALTLALAAQLVYLAVRFRWTFAASAVVAMFHDVVLLLGAFAWLGKQVDGVFVAALLTVVGYSINDSVVVFDRIREERRSRSREPFAVVANEACLHTIPRTLNTGLGAVFILVALFLLGGDTLTDFALALLIGIGVGTWSSVFTAAPLVVLLERTTSEHGRDARSPARATAAASRGKK